LALQTNFTREYPTNNVEVDKSPIPSVVRVWVGWLVGSVTKSQNNGDFKVAVMRAAEAHPNLDHTIPYSIDNLPIVRGPAEQDPETDKWVRMADDPFPAMAVMVQCSPEHRDEVIHMFMTLFDPNMPLSEVPHHVLWSFIVDIHEADAEPTEQRKANWVEGMKDHFQLAHTPSKGDSTTKQPYAVWITSDLLDLDTPNPDCDNYTLLHTIMMM
jgi:hypothetical protein